MADENKKYKRKSFTLEDKIQILNRLKDGEKVSSIAKSLNLNESTVRTMMRNEKKIRKSIAEGRSFDIKRMVSRDTHMAKMENALMIWLEDCIDKKIPLRENIIKRKALEIYQHLKRTGHPSTEQPSPSFTASEGWLRNLKKRFSLYNINLQGEQASDMNSQNVKEQFQGQSLREEQLMEFIDKPTSNVSIDDHLESMNNELFLNFSVLEIQKGLELGKQLELHFVEKDPSVARREKFKKELDRCLLPYRELLEQLQNDSTSVPTTNLRRVKTENITNDEDFRPFKTEELNFRVKEELIEQEFVKEELIVKKEWF